MKTQQVLIMMTEKEWMFLDAHVKTTNMSKNEFFGKALIFFNELGGKNVIKEFKKNDTIPRVVKNYMTISDSEYYLLKKLSKEFSISYSELARIVILYYSTITYVIPTMKILNEVFLK